MGIMDVQSIGRRAAATAAAMLLIAAVASAAGETEPDFDRIITSVKPALVKVLYHAQTSKGMMPGGGRWRGPRFSGMSMDSVAEALRERRPAEFSGILVGKDLVVTDDLPTHPRFIKRIEVVVGSATVPAEPAGVATECGAAFLRLRAPAAGATPLTFDAKAKEPYFAVTHGRYNGRWTVSVRALGKGLAVDETGERWCQGAGRALVVNAAGVPVGVSAEDRLPADGSWKGSPRDWKRLDADQFKAVMKKTADLADRGLVKVQLKFRVKVTSGRDRYMYRRYSSGSDGNAAERNVLGVVTAADTVLVLAELDRQATARLEKITIHAPGGKRAAEFVGTLHRYGGLLVRLKDGAKPLTPLVMASEPVHRRLYHALALAKVDCSGDRRVAYYRCARCLGRDIGRDGIIWPRMGNEGGFYFDLAGRLAAVPISFRDPDPETSYYRGMDQMACPVTILAPILADPKAHFDAALVPLSEREEKRLVWLGIEAQPLTDELAKLRKVSELTANGQKGVLISYVYPGSPAEKAGVKAGDVLVHFVLKGEAKPTVVRVQGVSSQSFPWDRLDQVPDQYLDRIPQPWPSRANNLTQALTNLGPGKEITALFARDGVEKPIHFTLALAPYDFETADKYKHETMGLTVKTITYELRRYYHLTADAPGVVVAKVQPGGKAAVAKVKPYEIVTHVNGDPVATAEAFKAATAEAGEYQLTIMRMQRKRLAKLTITAPPAEKKDEKD